MGVPKLRFAGFSGYYEIKTMMDVCKINQGLQIPIAERLTTPSANCHFYITNEFLKEGSSKKYYVENPASSVMCDENDLLMTRTGNTGVVVKNVKGVFHNNFFKIKYNNLVLKDYLYYFLLLDKTQRLILKLAGTSTIPDLNHGDFYSIEIALPTLSEQRKITQYLTVIDQKITLLNKQYDLLCQYKQGLMQKIFSQELRFKDKDGKDFPKWDNKKIGSLISEYKCKTTKENEWPVMTSSRSGLVLQREYYGENRLTERSNIGFNIIPCDYLTYRSRSDDGLFFFNQNKLNITGCISVYYPVFKFKYGNNYFYTTMFNYYKNLFRAYAVGSSQLVLSITDLKEMKFLIPSPDEQKKISEFLSAIDKRIDTVKSTLDKLKTWKQGLLQQMFV